MNPKNRWNRLPCSPFLLLIRFYQTVVSPVLPISCRFYPSCSEYAKQALVQHGLIVGGCLSVYRILRCHPFCRGGVDEVPETVSFFRDRHSKYRAIGEVAVSGRTASDLE